MSKVVLPTKGPLLSGKGWTAFFVALIVVCAIAPVLNIVVPVDSPLHMSDYAVALVGKIMCYAICATNESDTAQCHGNSFQFRNTMKSGIGNRYWPSLPIWRIRYMPIA